MKIGDNVVLRGTIKGVTYGKYGFPHYLVTLPNGCETEFPKPYIEDLQQLDKPEKVKVKQCVADWIEEARKSCKDVADFFDFDFTNEEVGKWFMQERPFDLAARAWLDGYEIEEEKKFFVKIKCLSEEYKYLNYFKSCREWLFSEKEETKEYRTAHTRKELEEAGFGWVFSCEGIEIEEVE